jgi:drug/metabolite transporter (DMT)-like permease
VEQNRLIKGYCVILLSVFLFSIQGLCIKSLPSNFRVWDILFYRLGGGLIILICLNQFSLPKNPLLILRGVVGTVAFSSLVLAIQNLPFSTAIVIFYSFPLFSALFSLLFKEKITLYGDVCLVLTLLGIIVLFNFNVVGSTFGKLIALNSAVFAGLTVSLIRKLNSYDSTVIYSSFCLIGTILCFYPFILSPQLPSNTREMSFIFLIIVLSLIGQLLMNIGFKYCKSWEGGVFMSSELIFSTILGILVLHETVGMNFLVGSLLIFSGSVLQFKK